jgi:Cu(I)/Ag(I) efflux system membrane fusion protein
MYGELRIPVEPKSSALTVPLQALVRETNGCFVFVRTSDTTFVKTPVTAGAENCDRVEISQGVKEGDRVVTNGSFLLKSEMKKDAFAEEE